jgi:hypothetical protein
MTEQKQVDINSLTVDQLKVIAYDQLVLIEQSQANLKTVNAKIAEKLKGDTSIEA